ncbi:MAG TPA: GNAT family N-acetyltransferase [Gemmatimonadales bacterium]|nr:GNAT family N-acetyltransferase [Gemmatimonadales bacterium]
MTHPFTRTDNCVLETARLRLRRMTLDDTDLILSLLNDADFIKFIGDKGVRTPEDAREYIRSGPLASYDLNGFGLWLVELIGSSTAIGMCGLLRRPALDDVDLGFAFLPEYRSQGYAFEAAAAVVRYGREMLGFRRIVAIANSDNAMSIRVLEKIGMKFDRLIRLSEADAEIKLMVSEHTPAL